MKKAKMTKTTMISLLIVVLGLAILIMGASGTFDFCGHDTYYETYGGDAYTGIQNAAADASNNLCNIGYMLEDFVNTTYILSGILLMLVGAYLAFSNLQDESEEDAQAPAPTPTETNSALLINQLNSLKTLLDCGIITQEEFDAKKKQLPYVIKP